MRIKAVIVDDEFLARQRIIKLLESHDNVDVVGEAKNADMALDVVRQKQPDLIFLDIQMPGDDGFSVISKLDQNSMPVIIFTTAFDQYALDAFKVHALDYLLKPFDEDRFNEAVGLAIEQLELKRSSNFNKKIMGLLNDFRQEEDSGSVRQFKIKEKGREFYIDVNEILYVESAGNYVIFHAQEKQTLYRATMSAVEEQLDSSEFLRIHRSYLLNKRAIKSSGYAGGNEFNFEMKNGKKLQSAKSYKASIQDFLDLNS